MLDRYLENMTKEASDRSNTRQAMKKMSFAELAKLAGIKLAENVCLACGSTMEKRGSMLKCSCGMMKRAGAKCSDAETPQKELQGRLDKVTGEKHDPQLTLPAGGKPSGSGEPDTLSEKKASNSKARSRFPNAGKEKTAFGLAKRIALGAGLGAGTGALTAGEGNRGSGALRGAGLGTLLGGGGAMVGAIPGTAQIVRRLAPQFRRAVQEGSPEAMRAFEKGLSGVRLHPAIEALPVATGSAAALGGGYLGGRSARKSKSASALKKEAILAGTIAGGVTGSRKGRPWEGAGWGALGGLGGAIASNLTTKALFGRPLILPGMAASGLAGHYLAKHMMKDKKKKASVKLARDMPHFTEQDRPEKVKDIYRALKRDHPDMPAAMKARIAARQGKKGKQHQGPPYKGPLTKKAGIQKESIVGTTIGAIGAGEGNRVRGGLYGLGLGNALAVPGFLTRNPALMAAGAVGGGALGAYLARKHGKATKKTKKAAVSFNSGVPTEFEKEALMPLLRSAGRVLKGAGKAAVGGNFARAGKIMKAAPKAMAGQWKGMSTGQKLLATGVGAGGAGLAAGHMLTPQNKVVVASVEPDLMDVGEKAGRLLAKSAALNNTPISPEELEESIQEAQGREDIPGRARRWGIAGGLGGGAVGALPGIAGTLAMKRIRGKLGLPGALAGAGLTGLGALAGGALGQRLGSGYGAEEAAADKAVSLLRALRAHQAGAQLGYGAGLRQGSAVGGFEPGEGRRP